MRINRVFSVLFAAAMCLVLFFAIIFLNNSITKDEQKNDNIITNNDDENTAENNNDVNYVDNIIDSEEQNELSKEKVVTFLAAGDNIIHQNVMDDAKRLAVSHGSENEYYFEPMYENIKDMINSADIAFVNQEGPIAGKELSGYSGYPNFNAPNEAGTALVNLGFDIVNIANNHLLDRGEKGYAKSIEFWENQPVTLVGGYKSENDFNTIRYFMYDDLKIALLSYTYGTNGIYLPSDSAMWVPYYDKATVDKHSKEARANADLVIVSMHWGAEGSFIPNDIQEQYCNILVNNNVDVVIGTHPHVLQPVEWKDRPDGGKTLVAYSIGNMLSTMLYSRYMVGGILEFDIRYTHPDDAVIENPRLTPTLCYYNKSREALKIHKLSDVTEDMYYSHGCTLNENVSYTQAINYVSSTIDSEFLSDDFLAFKQN